MFDKRLNELKLHFGITKPEDWQAVDPYWILARHGVGKKILNYLRTILAARGLTLRNDRTPEYWKKHLPNVKILEELGDSELADEGESVDTAVICPFTVFVDSNETAPFTFAGLTTDADEGNCPLIVPTEWRSLGRYPNSLGDYTVDGLFGRCHGERKSQEDAYGTFLGFADGRRERFESELKNLSEIHRAIVVVESGWFQFLANVPDWGKKPAEEKRKILFRSVLSWQYQFPNVQWHFCDSRWLAEVTMFRFLEKCWNEDQEVRKEAMREAVNSVAAPETVVGLDAASGSVVGLNFGSDEVASLLF